MRVGQARLTKSKYMRHNPMDALIVRNILEAGKRDKAKPVTKKLPLSSTIVEKIIEKHASRNADLKNLRISCICVMGFSGFLCYNELANITTNHVQFREDHIRIFIPTSKTDVY